MPEHFRDPKETQSVSGSFCRRQKMLFSTLKKENQTIYGIKLRKETFRRQQDRD